MNKDLHSPQVSYRKTVAERLLFKKWDSSPHGLSTKEVRERQRRHGLNVIQTVGKVHMYEILLRQFTNVMVLILILALIVSVILGETVDAYAIGAIIVINAIIGFTQEFRAEEAVEALKKMAASFATVIREGQTQKISADELVPGDILVLEEGMQVAADARLLKAVELSTLEASLTGESQPIPKTTGLIENVESLGDMRNMVFLGTVVSKGHGLALVTATGMKTEFGRIAHLVQTEKDDPAPLQKQLNSLSRVLAVIVLGLSAVLLFVAWITGRELAELFVLTLSLAVSAIPEGLPAIITLTLALGVQKIAKQNAIMRKLSAAETLGSTSVICTDKTGTLTQNEMTVQVVVVNGKQIKIKGIGYEPSENVKVTGPEMELLIKAGALCNNSMLIQSKEAWSVSGDPTEGALLTLAEKAGYNVLTLEKELPRKDELIFDSDRKRMSTKNGALQFTKGAPDALLEVCDSIQIHGKIQKLTAAKKREVLLEVNGLAKKAYRVLGFAYKKSGKFKEENLIFIGLAGIMDPPRPEVKAAIASCRKAHIEVVMITGDHALTAEAIGRAIGLFQRGDQIVTGAELEKMGDEELLKKVEKIRIYARVSPHHKVKILNALQSKGHVVAMTGDGVNDAPALKSADIGITMGITGTDVSKEASEMILVDDNFATIVSAIESGRSIYRNIKKSIRFLLSANFDEILLVSTIFFLGLPLPYTALQLLWINLLTDALPALALGTDTPEKGIMELKPRDPKKTIWKDLIQLSVFAGIISAFLSFIRYFYYSNAGTSIEEIRTVIFTSAVIFELFLVFSVRFGKQHFFTHFFKNKFLLFGVAVSLGLQLMAIYHPFLQNVLETQSLDFQEWMIVLLPTVLGIGLIEGTKLLRKKETTV